MTKNDVLSLELVRLAESHGGLLRARDVVAAARDETSPLHSQFEWDDSIASEKYREHQARQLMVRVQYVQPNQPTHDVLVSLSTDRRGGGGYRLVRAVLEDPEQRQQMLADAKAEMRAFTLKYRHLTELTDVFAAMVAVLDEPVSIDERASV